VRPGSAGNWWNMPNSITPISFLGDWCKDIAFGPRVANLLGQPP
jgi:hypothetical protein